MAPTDLSKSIETSMVSLDEVQARTRKGYTADLVADIEEKLAKSPKKAYMIRCKPPLSPRHLANVLRQRIGKKYALSSSETEKTVWIYKQD